jgi:serine/threonine kinase PknH
MVEEGRPVDEMAFGRYRLLSKIGEGGMGKVYKAHDTEIGRDVAIKVLATELGTEPGYRARFRREARIAARLTEPHIIPIYDTGEIEGRLYLVMPIIEGTDLHELLQRDGPMNPQRAVSFIEQLAAALDVAHAAGLVHRDIKPSNALLTGKDFVYLIDFGIAHDSAATKLTSTGMFVGTLAYMAPERFSAGVADARSDVYALACVLHECLTGHAPYPGDSMEQQLLGHLTLDPPRPSADRPDIPAGFDEVIARGMAKNPDERYQSAHELATAAKHALGAAPPRAPETARTPRADPSPGPAQATVGTITDVTPAAARPKAVTAPRQAGGSRQRGPVLIGAAVTIAVIAATFLAYQAFQPKPPASQTATAQSLSMVPRAALEGLLLTPDQLGAAMGATGMTVNSTASTLPDTKDQVPDKACLPLESPGQATVYADSGFTAVAGQRAADQPRSHEVKQMVILFSSAQQASAFFEASAKSWPACANREHTEANTTGQPQVHTVGPVTNTNGTLSATVGGIAPRNGAKGSCERALTVANNVAIDVASCSLSPTGAALNIAGQIAAKVPAAR